MSLKEGPLGKIDILPGELKTKVYEQDAQIQRDPIDPEFVMAIVKTTCTQTLTLGRPEAMAENFNRWVFSRRLLDNLPHGLTASLIGDGALRFAYSMHDPQQAPDGVRGMLEMLGGFGLGAYVEMHNHPIRNFINLVRSRIDQQISESLLQTLPKA